jgi:hypothetical protein
MALLCALLLPVEDALAYVYGQVGPGPGYPANGTITFLSYLRKAEDDPNLEILTEDNWNSGLGIDQGYQTEYFWLDWSAFLSPTANDNDTLVFFFTGIGAAADSSGDLSEPVDTDVGIENLGNSSWDATSNPGIPTNLNGSAHPPGTVHLSWTGTKQATYQVFRSSQASGAGNGASNGRYYRLAQDLASPSYVDSNAPLTLCWYIVVAEDGGALSGHSEEIMVDATLPVTLSHFTARGAENMVVVEWSTASEWENDGFRIYRRVEGMKDFELLIPDLISGAGNSSATREYTWIDRDVQSGQTYWYQLTSVDFSGHTHTYGPVSATPLETLPQTYALSQNYPNPFNPETWINYQLPEQARVTIKVYNIRGQLVDTLVDTEKPAGAYRVRWNGQDLSGRAAASGIYFCHMQSGVHSQTVKMILLR